MTMSFRPSPINNRLTSLTLSTNGDGTGTTNAIGNYAATPTLFYVQPPVNRFYQIARVAITISDNGQLEQAGYGANGIPLINGIIIQFRIRGNVINSVVGPIRTNLRFVELSTVIEEVNWATNARSLRCIFDFSGVQAEPFVLNGTTLDYLGVVLNDDFTFLTGHTFVAVTSIT